jgi:Uma2 family endonuclease
LSVFSPYNRGSDKPELATTLQLKQIMTKKPIYQDIFRTPEYFWFHPETPEFKGFRLSYRQNGEIPPRDRSK